MRTTDKVTSGIDRSGRDSVCANALLINSRQVSLYALAGIQSTDSSCMRFHGYRLREHVHFESATVIQTHCHGLTGLCCATISRTAIWLLQLLCAIL